MQKSVCRRISTWWIIWLQRGDYRWSCNEGVTFDPCLWSASTFPDYTFFVLDFWGQKEGTWDDLRGKPIHFQGIFEKYLTCLYLPLFRELFILPTRICLFSPWSCLGGTLNLASKQPAPDLTSLSHKYPIHIHVHVCLERHSSVLSFSPPLNLDQPLGEVLAPEFKFSLSF